MQPLDAVAPLAAPPSKVDKGKTRGNGVPRLTDSGLTACGGRCHARLNFFLSFGSTMRPSKGGPRRRVRLPLPFDISKEKTSSFFPSSLPKLNQRLFPKPLLPRPSPRGETLPGTLPLTSGGIAAAGQPASLPWLPPSPPRRRRRRLRRQPRRLRPSSPPGTTIATKITTTTTSPLTWASTAFPGPGRAEVAVARTPPRSLRSRRLR